MIRDFFRKMKGVTQSPPRVKVSEIIWAWVGGFLGIALMGVLHSHYFEKTDMILIIGSFGSSAVLIYGAIRSPLAQPRNFIGGHLISALTGVFFYKFFFPHLWLASAFAVATCIALMHLTRTLHPPAGATALIAVIGGPKVTNLGYLYVLMPVGLGVLLMLVVALVVNNISPQRRYPEFWF